MGAFIDQLGERTNAGRWTWFITLTYRTPSFDRVWSRNADGSLRLIRTPRNEPFPWGAGFPSEQAKPHPDFVHNFFAQLIEWIEHEVHARAEYFVVDQLGEAGGRLHQHCGLSWPGLFEYHWKDLQDKIWKEAGFNRILPWTEDAGYYIGRYIGRDAGRSHWDFRAGVQPVGTSQPVGRQVVAVSAAPPDERGVPSSREFRKTMAGWHR